MDIQRKLTELCGEDKIMHFLAGGWITCIASEWYYALLMGFFIGLLKEVADKYLRKSTFDVWDWMATFAGSVVTALVLMLV